MNVGATNPYASNFYVAAGGYPQAVRPQVMASATSRGYSPGVVINSPPGRMSSPSLADYKGCLQSAQTMNFTGGNTQPQSPTQPQNIDDPNADPNAPTEQPAYGGVGRKNVTDPDGNIAITAGEAPDLAAKKVKADIATAPPGTNIGGEIAEQQTAESNIPEEEQSPEQQVDNAINSQPVTSVA